MLFLARSRKFLVLYPDRVLYLPQRMSGRQGWRKRNAMIWLSRERREGMKTLRHHAQDATFHHVRYFLCCCNAQNTEKNGCNPVCTVSRSKIEVGNFKVSSGLWNFSGSRIHMHRETDGDLPVWKAHFLGQALIDLAPLTVRHRQLTWFSNVDPFSRNSYKIS